MANDVVDLYERMWKKADELAAKEVAEDVTVATAKVCKLTKDDRRQRHVIGMLELATNRLNEP